MKEWENIRNNLMHTDHKMKEGIMVYVYIGMLCSEAELNHYYTYQPGWVPLYDAERKKKKKKFKRTFGSNHTKNQIGLTEAKGHSWVCHFQERSLASDSLSWLPLEGRPWVRIGGGSAGADASCGPCRSGALLSADCYSSQLWRELLN